MPAGQARTTDEIADNVRSLVDRMVEAKFTKEMSQRGQELAAALAERGSEMGERVEEAWRESAPMRRRTAKEMARAGRDAARWSQRTWRRAVRPAVRDLWKQRVLAIGAASAAVPAGKELVDQAAVRLGMKRREERHWGAFFLGLLIGAAVGAIAALLAAPKPGRETRRELASRAGEMRDELATRARDVEWVPLFERGAGAPSAEDGAEAVGGIAAGAADAATDVAAELGETAIKVDDIADEASEMSAAVTEGAADAGADAGASIEEAGEVVDQAADETAQAINDAFEPADTTDREQSG